jgi:hypothetical protein
MYAARSRAPGLTGHEPPGPDRLRRPGDGPQACHARRLADGQTTEVEPGSGEEALDWPGLILHARSRVWTRTVSWAMPRLARLARERFRCHQADSTGFSSVVAAGVLIGYLVVSTVIGLAIYAVIGALLATAPRHQGGIPQ